VRIKILQLSGEIREGSRTSKEGTKNSNARFYYPKCQSWRILFENKKNNVSNTRVRTTSLSVGGQSFWSRGFRDATSRKKATICDHYPNKKTLDAPLPVMRKPRVEGTIRALTSLRAERRRTDPLPLGKGGSKRGGERSNMDKERLLDRGSECKPYGQAKKKAIGQKEKRGKSTKAQSSTIEAVSTIGRR